MPKPVSDISTIKKAYAPRWNGGQWLLAEHMLKEMQQLFAAHQLPFFLTYGSLLGAVRHGGVIPWDDDIDIAIFAQDEARLHALATELRQAGYGLVKLTKENPDGSIGIFYKIWILAIATPPGRTYSWPYIDIFLVRPTTDWDVWMLDDDRFPAACFQPLGEARFGALTLPVPANGDIVRLMYGANYKEICASPHYDHRRATPCTQIFTPTDEVMAAGCFVSLSDIAQQLLNSTAVKMTGWSLSENKIQLKGPAAVLNLDSTAASLWNALEEKATVAGLINLCNTPRIEAIYTVLERLGALGKAGAIRIDGNKVATG